jgi:tetraacyldisaccharide 4'-kinase
MSLAARVQRIWYGGEPVPWWLGALQPVYRMLRAAVLLPWRFGWRRPARIGVPVVVVGNLTAGGSGKTPLVIALVTALRGHGFTPGVVSRGYGGRLRGPLLLDAASLPGDAGDEPCLIRQETGVAVAVGRDRVAAARLLVETGVDVIIADDGLQHAALARDVEICVIDGARRFGNRRLLPAGPLRETVERLQSVDFIVCNGGTPGPGEMPMRLEPVALVALDDPADHRPLASLAGRRVHALAGIGNPQRFFSMLRDAGIGPVAHAFPDHHRYVAADLAFAEPLPLLMTAKDAIKCRAFAPRDARYLAVRAWIPEALVQHLALRLRAAVNSR